LLKDIIDRPKSEREEEDTDTSKVGPSVVGHKRKVQDAMDITLPYLPNAVITVDHMLRKVSKLRYFNHDVRNASKFPDLVKETYLTNIGEIGPLGKPIMEPA